MAETEIKAAKPRRIADSGYRSVVSYVISFILSVFLLLATVCAVAYLCVFSESHLISLLGNGYYEGVLKNVVTSAEDITMPTGIDISVVDGVFDTETVKRDVDGYIKAAFRGEEYVPDTADSDARLYRNVSEFLDSHDVTLVEDKKDTINAYINEVNAVYAKYTRLPGLGMISEYRVKYVKPVGIAFIALAVLSAVLAAVIIKMYHHPHRGMRFIAYAFGGTALMSFAAPLALLVSGRYEGIQLSPEHFYRFAVDYISDALTGCIIAAAVWLVLTIACVAAIYFMRQKLLQN